MWIDSHAHLNDLAFAEDVKETVDYAAAHDVAAIIVVGCDLASSAQAIKLAATYPGIWATVGVHPHDAKTWDDAAAQQLISWLAEPKVVAVGEIGLDYYYDYSPREEQRRAFWEQLAIAKQYNKPVIIHNRDAHQDTLTVVSEVGLGKAGGVMHCFTGSKETGLECLRLGLYISFAGPITFNNASRLREVAAALPLERLLVETDCPYLTPHPYRGKRNQPGHVGLVGAKLAEIKGLSETEVMAVTAKNTRALFNLPDDKGETAF